MDKRNHFSDKYKSENSDELRGIVNDSRYQKDAKIAAVWELEQREEASEEDQDITIEIKANYN
ncbi:MAG: hypothetical protein ACJA1A_003853 [Saprospiraceae bacterium]|jgi:hypothetical protein